LWPEDAQKTANQIREHLVKKFKVKKVGVVITDSTSTPLRLGTTGIALGFSGFEPLNDYNGTKDLFGRPFEVSWANVAGGLAAAAVLAMGEGTEQTPMALIKDVPFVKFKTTNPTKEELAGFNIPINDDLFAPFLNKVKWLHGTKKNN